MSAIWLHRMAAAGGLSFCALFAWLFMPSAAQAQAGPPYLTNDPGTPGSANWEINLASMQTITRASSAYQIPQIDLNFGVGDRIQLTYEIPHVLQADNGQPLRSGWSNGYPGVKWRFLDQGEDGWQAAAFPQVETGSSLLSRQKGIAEPGPRYLLPFEVSKRAGPIDLDFEAGYYVAGHRPRERILGFVAGRSVTERLELDAEIYDDRAENAPPHATTLDFGGRYKLRTGVIALFMAGRSINGFADGQPEFMAYAGVQILLSNYGRTFTSDAETMPEAARPDR
jgi:hypothetical protein